MSSQLKLRNIFIVRMAYLTCCLKVPPLLRFNLMILVSAKMLHQEVREILCGRGEVSKKSGKMKGDPEEENSCHAAELRSDWMIPGLGPALFEKAAFGTPTKLTSKNSMNCC